MQPWDIAGSLQGSELNQRKIQQTDADVAGQAAAGNFVKSLFNGSVPGAQPMQPPTGGQPPMGGQSPMQPQPPTGGQPQAPPQPMGGQPQPPQPQAISAGGGMPQAPQNAVAALAQRLRSMVPGAQPMMLQAGQMPQAGAGSPPPTPGGPPGGDPSSQPPGGNPIQSLYGQMTLQQVAQGVVRSNPGIEKNPQALFSAMRQLMPLMRPDEAQYFRALQLQQQQQHNTVMEGIAQQRADTGDTRAATAATQGGEKIDLAKQREARLAASGQERTAQAQERISIAQAQLKRGLGRDQRVQILGQLNAELRAIHNKAMEQITSAAAGGMPMDATERTKLLADEDQRYQATLEQYKKLRDGDPSSGNSAGTQPVGGAAKPGNVIKYDAQGNRITQPGGQGASPFESMPGKQSGVTDRRVLSDAGPMPVRAGQQLAMAGEGDEPTLLTGETYPPSASPEMAEENKRLQAPFAMTRTLGGGRPTPLMRPANENVKGLDDSRTQAELKKMRIEKKFEELRNRLLPPATREIPPDVLRAMKGYFGNLGFDYPGQALSAIRADIKAGSDPKAVWDIRPEDELQWRRIMDYIKKN